MSKVNDWIKDAVDKFNNKIVYLYNRNPSNRAWMDGKEVIIVALEEKIVRKIGKFIRSLIMEIHYKTLTEAIEIFEKYKNEPMTGQVVLLELKGLRGDYEVKDE